MVSSWWLCIVHHWSRSNVCGFRPFFYEVYTGLVLFAIGSETSGSITYAAFRCGVTALQPTFGAVGRSGVMSIAESLDKLGPFCRNSADCVIVLVFWIPFGGRTQMMFHPETLPSQILLQLTEDADICYDRIKDIPCITCPNKPEESMFVMVKPSFEPSQRHQR